jgi:hypothetical protein
MFHWDLPEALPGGWQSRDTSKAFADYAGYMAKHLGDRVHHFMTTNEFICFTDYGYKSGQFAPGLKLPDAAVAPGRSGSALTGSGKPTGQRTAETWQGDLVRMRTAMASPSARPGKRD